jgi:predicted Zn finger-like uncharacterized protein
MFKVVPDQLKISDGWVRCGHCAEVFDGRLNMQPGSASPVPRLLPAANVPPTRADEIPVAAWEPEAWPAAVEEAPATAAADLQGDHVLPDLLRDDEPPENIPLAVRHDPAPAPSPPPRPVQHDASAELAGMSFMRQARRHVFWSSAPVRMVLVLTVLLLLAGLALQVAFDQRDRLVAFEPRARPWVEAACIPLRCAVAPLRQIESLVIDGASFNKLAPQVYRLGFAVRNTGPIEVAVPAIELTLTDAQDQPVLRRVMKPAELGFVAPSIKAGAEWAGSALVRLAAPRAEVAGYRILAFYP